MDINLFNYSVVRPFSYLGLKNGFFDVNLDTLVATWIGMALLIGLSFLGRFYVKRNPLSVVSIIFQQGIEFFADLTAESMNSFTYKYFAFIASIFYFTLSCNMVSLLPFVEESTKDLNTTLAIALCSFAYVQTEEIRHVGFIGYIKAFFEPMWFMFPLAIIGKLASVVSMSFRLFGNILGGSIIYMLLVQFVEDYSQIPFIIISIITLILYYVLGKFINISDIKWLDIIFKTLFMLIFLLAGAQMFFGVFEAVVQAFVITMLTLTYLAIALTENSTEEVV